MITPEEGFPTSEFDPAADARATPRPEEEIADGESDPVGAAAVVGDPPREPAAGGDAGGPPAQGEGAPDSW